MGRHRACNYVGAWRSCCIIVDLYYGRCIDLDIFLIYWYGTLLAYRGYWPAPKIASKNWTSLSSPLSLSIMESGFPAYSTNILSPDLGFICITGFTRNINQITSGYFEPKNGGPFIRNQCSTRSHFHCGLSRSTLHRSRQRQYILFGKNHSELNMSKNPKIATVVLKADSFFIIVK